MRHVCAHIYSSLLSSQSQDGTVRQVVFVLEYKIVDHPSSIIDFPGHCFENKHKFVYGFTGCCKCPMEINKRLSKCSAVCWQVKIHQGLFFKTFKNSKMCQLSCDDLTVPENCF